MSSTPVEHLRSVEISWTSQRLDLKDGRENWTGMTNPTERRKLQNRLNQMARRIRARQGNSKRTIISDLTPQEQLQVVLGSEAGSFHTSGSAQPSPVGLDATAKASCMCATPRYVHGTPALSHLGLLVRYNVSSGFARNADMLGVTAEYYDWDGISPFIKEGPSLGTTSPQRQLDWPSNLQPTQLQRSIEHHPWVDLFPWPQVRDNTIRALQYSDICDEDELCHDICEYEGHDAEPMLLVWVDAWDAHSWEITPAFLKKWGWLLSECDEFLEGTNNWRAKRGEKPLSTSQVLEAVQTSMPALYRERAL